MANVFGPRPLKDFSGGMNSQVTDALLPSNTMRLIRNFDVDEIGALKVRRGLTAIGDQVQDDKPILGLFNYRDSDGANHQQIAVTDNSGGSQSVTKYNNSGTWTAIGGGSSFTAGAKFRFATFVDYVFLVNSAFDGPNSWDGDTGNSWGTTNLTSAPAGQFIDVFKDRLYIAGTSSYPDRLFFSSIPNVTTLAITWDTTNDYLDVNPEDGMNITGLANTGSLLLIFKEQALYRWNGSATDPDKVIDLGTTSQESIAVWQGNVFFFNPFGVYITTGGYPTKISRGIQKWIDAIPSSNYSNVSAGIKDDEYYLSIGDVTVDGVAYNNTVLVYSIPNRVWRVYTFPEEIQRFAPYIADDGSYKMMVGNDDGDVQDFLVGDDDDGTAISFEVMTGRMDYGAASVTKTLNQMYMLADELPGATTFISTEDDDEKKVVAMERPYMDWAKDLNIRCSHMQLATRGSVSTPGGVFRGWELVDIATDGFYG